MDQESEQFLAKLEEQYGGSIEYRTFSTWFASSDGTHREFGVFLFEINNTYYYEDFERRPSILGIALKPGKRQPVYVKLEGSFKAEDIKHIKTVTKKEALAVVAQKREPTNLKEASFIERVFSQLVSAVEFNDGSVLFFELMNKKEFIQRTVGES
ncbi:MAG: hypothetical protein ACOX0W_06570 [Sphaerochaetaceae bacterium]|jgi:hypothetical protein